MSDSQDLDWLGFFRAITEPHRVVFRVRGYGHITGNLNRLNTVTANYQVAAIALWSAPNVAGTVTGRHCLH